MPKTKTQEEFINQIIKIHKNKYNYDKVNYIGDKVKVIITCKIHGDFEQIPSGHIQGRGCRQCAIDARAKNKKKSQEQFILESLKIHGNMYNYNKVNYKYARKKVIIGCKIHGDFEQYPYVHLKGNGCKKCGTVRTTNLRTKSKEEFINQTKQIHGDKYIYDKTEYINSDSKIIIICKIHGDFCQTPANHLWGKGCQKCAIDTRADFCRKTPDQFIIEAVQKHGDKYEYSKVNYINIDTKVIITCKKHGDFEQTPYEHLRGLGGCTRCPYKTETKCIEYLELISEEKFKKQRPLFLNGLELDGYSEKLKLAIEYNGEQHYEFIEFFHRNGPEDLESQKERDHIKQKLCNDNGVYLIVVPYYIENLKEFINQEYSNYLFLNSLSM